MSVDLSSQGGREQRWYVLGFTSDEIITAEQDARLAREVVRVWTAAGQPEGFAIWQTAGEGEHFIYWFLDEPSARFLDAHRIGWRRFLVDERARGPAQAYDALRWDQDPRP